MFSGIVTGLEKAVSIKKGSSGINAALRIPRGWKLTAGESINIDGVCTTVTKVVAGNFTVFWMPETLRVTTLSGITDQHEFNLEKCLTLNSLVGGHLVSGHVDCVGEIKNIKNEGQSKILTISLPEKFAKYLIYKGSVAVNGVSLTVVEANSGNFVVSLIPYTLKHTNLGSVKVGDKVNIELDLIAKYLEKLANQR